MQLEREVDAVKKALCLLLAVIFVCCVYVHGEDKRFSLEALITNLTNFQDMPTVQDIVDCWQNDKYYVGNVLMLPYWVDVYCGLNPVLEYRPSSNPLGYRGNYPLALLLDGTRAEHSEYDVTFCYLYNSMGQPLYITYEDGTVSDTNKYPVIFEYQKPYKEFEGDDSTLSDIKEFFSGVKGFFVRLWDCLGVIFRMVASVFRNLKYLLPWNSTVPKGV